jgi:hypothetical protein
MHYIYKIQPFLFFGQGYYFDNISLSNRSFDFLISKIGCGIMLLDIGKVSKKWFFHVLNDISEEKLEYILNTTSNNEINNLFEKIDRFC